MQGGPKGLDDPIDGIDKQIGPVEDCGDLVRAVPWRQREWQHREGVAVCHIDYWSVARHDPRHLSKNKGYRPGYGLETTEKNFASVLADCQLDLPQYLFLA